MDKVIKVNAICDREIIEMFLNGRSMQWLVDNINKCGVNISYSAFYHLLTNTNEWKLTYALLICRILECKVEDIFSIQE